MSDEEQEIPIELTAEEKEKEQKINKEIDKLKFFLEDAQECRESDDYEELKIVLSKCNTIHDKINEMITNLQELKLELGKSTTRSIRQWKKNLKANCTPLLETKVNLQKSLEKKQREESVAATEECLQYKHQREEQFRQTMYDKEKEMLEERMKAELKLTEKKMEMEMERAQSKKRTKLPELKITPFKGTPSDWIRFENMFISQIDKSPISDEEKFGYLLELVGPKVRDRFANLKPGSVGYKTAWERLQSEYGHAKLVSAAHMDELINLAPVRGTSYEKVREFYEKLTKSFDALQSLGEEATLKALVIPTINKMPQVKPDLVRTDDEWEEWDMSQLLTSIQKWLKRNRVEESPREESKKREKHFFTNAETSNATSKGRTPKCLYCSGGHWGEACTSYNTIEDRKRFFADKKLCFNCGRASHQANQCRSRGCFKCKGKHHTSLCTRDNGSSSDKPQQGSVLNGYTPSSEKSLPAIIPVQVNNTTLWAFLDTGSGRNFVSSEAARKLALAPIRQETQNIVTVNGIKRQSMPIFEVELNSVDNKERERIELTGSKMPDFTTITRPTIKELKQKYAHARGKTFYYVKSDEYQIDIILSDSFYCKIRTEQVYKGKPQDPIVEGTAFGWVIHGGSEYADSNCMYTKEINEHCERLCALDVLGVEDRAENDSSQVNEDFRENIVRQDDGRYEVSVPWIPGSTLVDSNEQASRRRLANTQRKLKQNTIVEAEYRKIVNDQLAAGVIERAPAVPDGDRVFYMPHKPVVRENATTTKVRMVFDASAKPCYQANSINDCMYTGPPLQPLLWDVMIRARMSTHLLLGDIEKAFLQIGIKKEDRDAFRFLFDVNNKEQHLRFTRVPFGAEASPFMLGATLQYHYDQQPSIFQDTVAILRENTYVDNLMKGGCDEDELERFKREATEILESAKFPVHKWESDIATLEDKDVPNPTKFLGHVWNKRDDTLEVTVNKPESDKPLTKITALKQLGSIYDPLGIISPVAVEGKRIYREVCEETKAWDSEASPQLQKQWLKWTSQLRNVKIPRAVSREVKRVKAVHLHVFADASKVACSAVTIAVIEHETGTVKGLLTSKSRISKRNATIPRLELVSGHMAANMVKNLCQALHHWPIQSITVWMDSMVALYWICNPGKQWKVFVANRVNKIAEITAQAGIQWKYCPTEKNLADLGSRGAVIEKLEDGEWFTGPEWLLHEEQWPEQPKLETSKSVSEECSPAKLNALLATERDPDEWDVVIEKHTYWKAMRITAWALRFVNNCRTKTVRGKETLPLTVEEISNAEEVWVKRVQTEVETDLESPGWTIVKDDKGVLRCKGRIQGYQPIYLEKGTFTDKLVRHIHTEIAHLGVPNTMAATREKYWIPRLRSKVKKVINECKKCKTFSTKPYGTTATAALPTFRTETSRPFQTTGVDFAGPLEYKISKDEKSKCYILIFTCATSRAIHLEVTKSQTAEELQQKLTAFITRRTRPERIISDNAQTFKTTAEWIQQIRKSEVLQDFLAKQNIRWQFNLAKSPWWGGMYERLIKDVKKTLYKTMGRANLTLEQFEAVVMDIERHLNNRPLTYMESEAGEEQVLTPNVIMWGQEAHAIEDIEPDLDEVSKMHLRLKEKKEHAWRRWKTEYIHSLMESHRINKGTDRHPEIGEIVLLVGDEKNRGEWKKGKVTKLIRGRDGVIRGVKILHKGHHLERPLSLVCPLEIKATTQTAANEELPPQQPMQRRSARQAAQNAKQVITSVLEDEELDI